MRSAGRPSCSPRQDKVGSEAVGTGRAVGPHGRSGRKEDGSLLMLGFLTTCFSGPESHPLLRIGWDGLEFLGMLAVSLGTVLNVPASFGWLSLVMGKPSLMVSSFPCGSESRAPQHLWVLCSGGGWGLWSLSPERSHTANGCSGPGSPTPCGSRCCHYSSWRSW